MLIKISKSNFQLNKGSVVMKKILSLLILVIMVITVMTPVFTVSAEESVVFSATDSVETERQTYDSSGNFFQAIANFFRSIFYSRITFDTDGGNLISDYYKLKFSRISKPNNPVKEGYTFIGWNPEIPERMPWKNMTVKAQWQVNEHFVYWNIDGETIKTETYAFGEKIVEINPGKKEGYSFSGWFLIPESMPDNDVIISGTYKKDTEIVIAENNDEFSEKVMELVNQSLNDENFDKEAALEDEFYMCRVVANCSDYSLIDFSIFEADTIVMNDDGTVVLQFSNRDLAEECSDYLNSLSSVSFAEADVYVEAPEEVEVESIPDMSNSIWSEKYINADKYAYYLENNNFNKSITVAVIDTGVDMDHPYLHGRISANGWNCFSKNAFPEDDTGHGTHVSGIIVNCTNNLNIKIVPIKALKKDGGSYQSIVEGITYAVSQNVDVINLSLESRFTSQSSYVENAINSAVKKGITVVVAAGNGIIVKDGDEIKRSSTDTATVCPANMDSVIVVGALDSTGTVASFSNYGESVDVIAPGVSIPSAYLNGNYALMTGTSQAAPHIAAVAAMFKLSHPDYTPAQIEALIKQYCVDKGPSGRDDFYGEGCPNMYNAIPDCTITFNSNGGSSVASTTAKNSSSVILPKPEKSYKVTFNANGGTLSSSYCYSACTFDGWYKTASLSDDRLVDGESYMLLKDQTLYAKWINNRTDITSYRPARNGYKFVGWFTSPSGGVEYTNASVISDNITLYAHWYQYTISYNANGGTGAPATQYGYGETYLSSTQPTRSGYKFLGWSTSSNATSASYSSGSKTSLYNNLNLYAVWGKKSITLSEYAGQGIVYVEPSNTWTLGDYAYGWRVALPTATVSNIDSQDRGWEVVSGNVTILDDYMYISQPGTVKVRYRAGEYYSDCYTYTLTLYKSTTGTNIIRSSTSTSATELGRVPGNYTIKITKTATSGTLGASGGTIWGYVTYNGVSGWIRLCWWS